MGGADNTPGISEGENNETLRPLRYSVRSGSLGFIIQGQKYNFCSR